MINKSRKNFIFKKKIQREKLAEWSRFNNSIFFSIPVERTHRVLVAGFDAFHLVPPVVTWECRRIGSHLGHHRLLIKLDVQHHIPQYQIGQAVEDLHLNHQNLWAVAYQLRSFLRKSLPFLTSR